MFQFERISVNQILILSETISDLSLLRLDIVKAKYLKSATNFHETLEFLKELALIKIKGNQILPTVIYKRFLNNLRKAKLKRQITQNFILKNILFTETSFSEYLNEYFSYFQMISHQYEFAPTIALRLKYKGLRNFLMDLEIISYDSGKKKYLVSDDYFLIFTEFKEDRLLTLSEFIKIREGKEELGRRAELQTILYEKNRLFQFPFLVKAIEHVAIKNVQAGYDIKSFESEFNKEGKPITRYIEVKAVPSLGYKFYWTINEIEKAKLYGENYYLYLLPAKDEANFDFSTIRIIKDPYTNIYKNNNEWSRKEELLSFSLNVK